MKTFKKFLNENYTYNTILHKYGYCCKFSGSDRHLTYTNEENDNKKILIDVGGNEWHYEVDGNVKKVGKLNDDSLEKFLNK